MRRGFCTLVLFIVENDSVCYVETACQNKVQGFLRIKFKLPTMAEFYYFPLKLVARSREAAVVSQEVSVAPMLNGEDVSGLTPEQTLCALSSILKAYCTATDQPNLISAGDFIRLSLSAMAHLKLCGCSNVVYSLVKCLGTMRNDGSDSLLPAK